jgi:hypothetical protein
VKGITIRQPWVELILQGGKPYEIRSWRTSYRGPIMLHAAKALDKAAVVALEIDASSLFRGGFVGRAELKDCRPFTRADAKVLRRNGAFVGEWSAGRFAWELANVCRLRAPVTFRGTLGLFNVPIRIIRKTQRQVSSQC